MRDAEQRMALAARRHYLDGQSRIEIAEGLGISRFAVARLLEQARERGIVRFEIASPADLDLELSAQLRAAFGLRYALVVHAPSGAQHTLTGRLGAAAARLLEETLEGGEILGLAAGRTLRQMVLSLRELPRVDVVQLEGVATGLRNSGVELVQRVASVSGGTPHALLAPLLTRSAESAVLLRGEPAASETMSKFAQVTTAVVGIGSWNPRDSQVSTLASSLGIHDRAIAAGVRADIGAILLDDGGEVIDAIAEHSIGIDALALRRVPHVLAVAGGPLKFAAVRAALRSGLIHSLACDASTAQALLVDASRRVGSSSEPWR